MRHFGVSVSVGNTVKLKSSGGQRKCFCDFFEFRYFVIGIDNWSIRIFLQNFLQSGGFSEEWIGDIYLIEGKSEELYFLGLQSLGARGNDDQGDSQSSPVRKPLQYLRIPAKIFFKVKLQSFCQRGAFPRHKTFRIRFKPESFRGIDLFSEFRLGQGVRNSKRSDHVINSNIPILKSSQSKIKVENNNGQVSCHVGSWFTQKFR